MKIRGFFVCALAAILLVSGVCSSPAFAQKKNLTLAIGLTLFPYNIPEMQAGIEFDIVKEALKLRGYTVTPRYVPFGQRNVELRNKTVDGALTITSDSGIEAFYSTPHIMYENIAVSLQKNNFDIYTIDDLKDKSIVTFQDATLYLGNDFAAMAKENARYQEIPDQETQVSLLFAGRTDVIILDRNIFNFYRHHYGYKQKSKDMNTNQEVNIHNLFPPTLFQVAFIDKQARDDFDSGLAELRKSGRYDMIIRKYTGR